MPNSQYGSHRTDLSKLWLPVLVIELLGGFCLMVGAFIIVVTLMERVFKPKALIALFFILPLGIRSQVVVYNLLQEKRKGWEQAVNFLARWAFWPLKWIYIIAAIALIAFFYFQIDPLGFLFIAALIIIPTLYKGLAQKALAVLESPDIAEHYANQKS